MRSARLWIVLAALVGGLALAAFVSHCITPSWKKNSLLHPTRRKPPAEPTIPHDDVKCDSEGIRLHGWHFPARGEPRGLIVYLHGFGDDRRGGEGIARRFAPLGFEVLAYDSRAHGRSEGEVCTYGVLEQRDLARILDAQPPQARALPVVLIGGSLGGAVALQAAASDARIALVVAIATYADLRTLTIERAPFFVTERQIETALRLVEREGAFAIDDAAPVSAAPAIRCPVLLVHGADDQLTPPRHSERILAALTCEKHLIIVPDVDHGDPAGDQAWARIEATVRAVVTPSETRAKAVQR